MSLRLVPPRLSWWQKIAKVLIGTLTKETP
jgi:hypothetical protein